MTEHQMRSGYVALIDVLGWKGIWKKHEVADILGTVAALKAAERKIRVISDLMLGRDAGVVGAPAILRMIASALDQHFPSTTGKSAEGLFKPELDAMEHALRHEPFLTDIHTAFLSDTFIVGAYLNPEWRGTFFSADLIARGWTSVVVATAIQACATGTPSLIFRGAVAPGKFLIDENLILGPAVDEAATLMNRAVAAIVWFTPNDEPDDLGPVAFKYPIPLHGGGTVTATAINPFAGAMNVETVERVHQGLLDAFGKAPLALDVTIKKQNTAAFLDVAKAHWLSVLSKSERNGQPPQRHQDTER